MSDETSTPPSASSEDTLKKKSAVKKEKPKKEKAQEPEKGIWWNRRDLLNLSGWLAIFGFLGTMLAGTLRFMIPRVLFEPPTAFKAGFPTDFTIGEVSEKFKKSYRVWIVRSEEGIYALYAVCTHLGCTPRWLGPESKFKCPCHGSGFYKEGINFEGPAPRPLDSPESKTSAACTCRAVCLRSYHLAPRHSTHLHESAVLARW